MCDQGNHTCSKDCQHWKHRPLNCGQLCRKQPEHEGPCDCESNNHLCGQPCDLDGCSQRCKEPLGTQHDKHWCTNSGCPKYCTLCGNLCASKDHFHAQQPGAVHLCKGQHTCVDPASQNPKLCSSPGVCEIRAQPVVEQRSFQV